MSRKNVTKGDPALPVKSQFLLYQTGDGQTRIAVRLQDETVWMTQAAMAELYQTTSQNITTHLKAIYKEGELEMSPTCKEYLQVQREGSRRVSRTRKFYNLPAIIAVAPLKTIVQWSKNAMGKAPGLSMETGKQEDSACSRSA